MGLMSDELDLLRECSEAGIIFHPLGGKLRPELTKGQVSAELRARVEAHKEKLLLFFVRAFDVCDIGADVDDGGTQGETGLHGTRGAVDGMRGGLGRVGGAPV